MMCRVLKLGFIYEEIYMYKLSIKNDWVKLCHQQAEKLYFYNHPIFCITGPFILNSNSKWYMYVYVVLMQTVMNLSTTWILKKPTYGITVIVHAVAVFKRNCG